MFLVSLYTCYCISFGHCYVSKEGGAQGDPLSMLTYAAHLISLIKNLTDQYIWIQNSYAKDSACTAKFSNESVPQGLGGGGGGGGGG